MSVPLELFDEDYLYFMEGSLAERSERDADTIVKLLELEPGMRVLDVPCGHGRIAAELTRRGIDVVGIDVTEDFLALARERYPELTLERGDMRELDYEGEFDAVVNWFTSWGYFDRAANDDVLVRFARALRPGGRLLLEFHNPQRLLRLIELAGGASASIIERDGDLMADRVTYDPEQHRSLTERFIVRGGAVRRLEFSLEQVPAAELEQRLLAAGLREVSVFGRDGEPFEPLGPRIIAVARR